MQHASAELDTGLQIAAANEPPLTGALAGLKILGIEDFDYYRSAIAAGEQVGWSYYFPFLLTQHRPGRSALLIDIDEGSICLYIWRVREGKPRLDIHSAPAPMNTSVLRRCLERASDFNGDRSTRVMRIDAKDSDAVATLPELRVWPRKKQYIFLPENYVDLAGKKYYTVRRNVSRVERLPDVEVRPFIPDDKKACRDLLYAWKKIHRDTHGTAGGVGISRRGLDMLGQLPDDTLRGQVILVDGKLSAFAFAGEIRPGLGCSFERKCDTSLRGMSYFQLRSLLLSLQEYPRVNDGSDTGRTGLRQLKDSFRPIEMHVEFRARYRNA